MSSHPETSPHAGNVYLLYGFRSGIQQALFDQLKAARLAQLATRGMVLQELSFATAFAFGAGATGIVILTPARMRAQASAIYLLFVNLIGIGLAPYLTAALTQYVFADDLAVGRSSAIVAGGVAKEYTIGNRNLKKYDMADLLQLESKLKAEVKREQMADMIANGLGNPHNLFVRF